MEEITVKEYAQLRGCTERYVIKLISENKLAANEKRGQGGNKGFSYMIPLASIEPKLVAKYRRIESRRAGNGRKKELKPVISADKEAMTAEEREEIIFWKNVLAGWDGYRPPGMDRKRATEDYVAYLQTTYPDQKFSARMLYRKKQALREQGETGLVDMRGKHDRHKKAVPREVFDIFEYYYLDQSQKSIQTCITLTGLEISQHPDKYDQSLLPLASSASFAREIERSIPVPVLKYYRLGEKACHDECANYIERTYDDLHSNDIWVCDNHTFDIFINDGDSENPVRVYLTAFLDVRSRKMVGWYVTDAPSSDATLQALRRGIAAYGIPKRIYSDNGREFLTHDIGGRGFRKSAKNDGHEPLTILQHLQIEFRTALVRNARAKIVERAFVDIKNCFSKLFEGYTGGTIAERPERLKKMGKHAENFIIMDEFREYVDIFIHGWFNKQPHSGVGMNGRTRDEVYAACLYEQRVATQDELNLMMLRTSRMQTVNRGVRVKFYEQTLRFYSDELIMGHDREKVYVRYNPDDLAEVRVYDGQDRFLCTAQQVRTLSYFASKDEVAEAMREQRTLERAVKGYKRQKAIEADDALELILREAEGRMAAGERLDPKIITPIRAIDDDTDIMTRAVGAEPIDWSAALERLEKVKED
ncbi:MAG: Mu transposase C-terminal domain-containing protein [Ruminococcus flavefaciens]|nr:Mu transposase C-terminal domain-containing protein [Ruminococcus flavefaciens]